MEGRVEVCHNQTWWAVSGSWYWNFNDATVVCRHLHYPANCKCYHLCDFVDNTTVSSVTMNSTNNRG